MRACEKKLNELGLSVFTTDSIDAWDAILETCRSHLKRGGALARLPYANKIWMLYGFRIFKEFARLPGSPEVIEVYPHSIMQALIPRGFKMDEAKTAKLLKVTVRKIGEHVLVDLMAPGSDGVTFEAIEAQGVGDFLGRIADALVRRSYVPLRARRQEIPKDAGKVRVLSIPAIRDRVVQGALKLILEPIFEADFQPGSFGYRPKRNHEAVDRVARAIVQRKTRVIDIDLRSYFDNVRHDRLLAKVAQRVDDADVMHLLKIILKACGKQGVPQGGVISPLLSNIYLTEVDRMLERAKEASRDGKYTYVEYAEFADDLVILIDAYKRHDWLMAAVEKRLREELAELQVEINEEKSRIVDLGRGESFGFLGFDFRQVRSLRGAWRAHYTPSSRSGRRCCGNSRICSAATNRNRLIGS